MEANWADGPRYPTFPSKTMLKSMTLSSPRICAVKRKAINVEVRSRILADTCIFQNRCL